MNITPLIDDGYAGPIKRLTCSICKHTFYITHDDYHRLPNVRFCHECSLIVREELEKTQGAHASPPAPEVREQPVVRSPEEPPAAPRIHAIPLPQPRTIARDKMTMKEMLEEAEMLGKTWRYRETLSSYEEALQRDPHGLTALDGRANMLSLLDRPTEALAAYDRLLTLEPGNAQAQSRKGELLRGLRRYDEAEAAFDAALCIDSSSLEASIGKWLLLTHLHRDEEAERCVLQETATSVSPQELEQPCQTAEDYRRRGDGLRAVHRRAEAIRAYEESLRLDPLQLDVYTALYTMRFASEYTPHIAAILDRAVQAFPASAKLHLYHAGILSQLERHQDTLEACNRAIACESTAPRAYRKKSEHLHALQREQEALATIKHAIALDPDAEGAYRLKAEILASLRRDDEAIAAYDQAIRLDSHHFTAYEQKAAFLAGLHRDADALATYDQFIEQTPHRFKGYQEKLSFLLFEGERFADALAVCELCLARNPELTQAHAWKGRVLSYLHRDEDALLSFDEALRLDGSDADLYVAKVRALARLTRFDEALTACEQALQLAPATPAVHKEKADILARQKRYDEALPVYQQAIQLNPDDADAHKDVGDFLSHLERFAEAVQAYQQALRLKPDALHLFQAKAHALKKLGRYEQALATYNKALQLHPKENHLRFSRAGVLKKLLRYEEANAEYLSVQVSARAATSDPLLVVCCILAQVDLTQVVEAQARLQAAGKPISDEAIEAEIHLMDQEHKIASLRSSPLFQPVCLLMHERQEWSGTPRQFKEALSAHFSDDLQKMPRSPARLVGILQEIAPALLVQGIAVGLPPQTALVTLTRTLT